MSSNEITIEEFLGDNENISIHIVDEDGYYYNKIKESLSNISKNIIDNANFFDLTTHKDIANIIQTLNTYPYFSDIRYVVVRGITVKDKEFIDEITKYLKNPLRTTKHIFLSIDEKVSLNCQFQKNDNLSKDNIKNFLNSELNRRKLELSSSIINELLNKSKDKLALSNYLDKAESLIRSDNKNVKIIEGLAQEKKQEVFNETYELINHINNKDLKSCLIEVKKTKFKENIFLELSKIAWRFRAYLKIKTLKENKVPNHEIIKLTNISKYQYKYFDKESSNKSKIEVLRGLKVLKEVDTLLKSTDINIDNLCFYLLKKLCRI